MSHGTVSEALSDYNLRSFHDHAKQDLDRHSNKTGLPRGRKKRLCTPTFHAVRESGSPATPGACSFMWLPPLFVSRFRNVLEIR